MQKVIINKLIKKLLLSIISLVFFSYHASAQTYTLSANLGTITTCAGTFVDGGGAGGNYSNNKTYTVTFCSGSSQLIKVSFSSFVLENGYDYLDVYDGPSSASTQLPSLTGTLAPFDCQSTGTCLTFVFTSDGSTTKAGWVATISCVTPCVTPTAAGVFTNQAAPVEVCKGEAIDFSGATSTAGPTFSLVNYNGILMTEQQLPE